MHCISILVGFYMLVMGVILLVSSTFYRLELDEMESGQGLLCPRSLYYTKIYTPKNMEEPPTPLATPLENMTKVPLCRHMKWWKLFAEIGMISGASYLIFLLSLIIVSCCCSYKPIKIEEEEAIDDESQLKEKERKGSKCCSSWVMAITFMLALSIVTLALSFIFLSSTQLEAIFTLEYKGEYGGIFEIYPPLVLYITSIWHFVMLTGFCIWLGIIVSCPSSLSIGQCVVI